MIDVIIHIADLHIRSGNKALARYDEYAIVFDRMVSDLAMCPAIITGKAIIVIAGDVFHHKLKIESPGIKLILNFLSRLAKLARVYIIRGNHDYRQDFPGEPDLIESLLSIDIPNVTYLSSTGHYKIDNLGIGLVAIQDALQAGNTCGISTELPAFPTASYFDAYPEVTTRIALFHGAVSKTKLGNGTYVDGYPLEWFKGYSVVMLGDIHLQQVNNGKPVPFNPLKRAFQHSTLIDRHSWDTPRITWAYAGSAIQQDFGEALMGHGFMLWNLPKKTIESYHVHSDYGYITVKTQGTEAPQLVLKNHQGTKMEPLVKVAAEPWFPRNVNMRFIGGEQEQIVDILKAGGINISKLICCPKTALNDTITANIIPDDMDITQFNTPNTWVEYIAVQSIAGQADDQTWREWFSNHETLVIPTSKNAFIQDRVADRNTKINKRIQEYQAIRDKHLSFNNAKKQFTLHHMSWDYILCFKDGNYFNFDGLTRKINAISAKNGMGKTSFLETVCIALYGEGFPSRFNKTYSASIICHQKPRGATAQTVIVLSVGGVKYQIKRKFTVHSSDANKIHCIPKDITLDFWIDGQFKNEHSGKTAVDAWVETHIGCMSAFLLSCMVTQNSDMDFFNLRTQDQKDLLDNALAINDSTEFHAVLKEAKLAHSAILDASQAALAAQRTYPDLSTLQQTLDTYRAKLDELNTSAAELQSRCNNYQRPTSEEEEIIVKAQNKDVIIKITNELENTVGNNSAHEEHRKKTEQLNALVKSRCSDDVLTTLKVDLKMHMRTKPTRDFGSADILKAAIVKSTWTNDIDHAQKCLKRLEEWYKTLKECECAPPYNPDCWACRMQPFAAAADTKVVLYEKVSRLCEAKIEGTADLKVHVDELKSHIANIEALQWEETRCELEWKLEKAEKRMKALEAEIMTLRADIEKSRQLALYKRCQDVYDEFFAQRELGQQITALQKDIISATIKTSLAEKEYQEAQEAQEMRTGLTEFIAVLQTRVGLLTQVYDIFSGFKSWLYKDKVIPYLQAGANEIIHAMCEERPLSIESVITSTGIHWFLRDGKSAPPIEKASGFQRFIAGLAMRIALGRFGASGIRANQLFLDEGFTACDAENLVKVGPFLENLPYKNIIIVSHLDDVKACARHHIFIERAQGSGLSKLVF
jgi:DNA repair exonuclease SbcCD ATPase subunit